MKAGASSCKRSPLIFNCAQEKKKKRRRRRRGGGGGKKGKGSPEKREKSGVHDAAGRGAVGRPPNFASQPESR